MRKIVSIKFGSHLYGTSTPASDIDIKSIYVPSARDILLQRVKGTIANKRLKQTGEKNYAGEIDEESYSLQRFLTLAAEGQTVALDVLFSTPASTISAPAREWGTIVENRHRLLTKKSAAFIGYVRTQSNKYGIRGSRVATSRAALTILQTEMAERGTTAKLEVLSDQVVSFVKEFEHSESLDIPNPTTGVTTRHWEVCGRKMPFTASIKNAHDVMKRLVDEYGHRALLAEQQQGVDWKALSHAVRVGTQALELLQTGHITFPLPNAEHIVAIKTGKLPYQQVAEEIEGFLSRVEEAAAVSTLPQEPDHAWIDGFVADVYGREVTNATL